MTLEEILKEMIKHSEENPTHGYDCACKDKYIRQARSIIRDIIGKENITLTDASYLFSRLLNS
jgi:hypothetical protein